MSPSLYFDDGGRPVQTVDGRAEPRHEPDEEGMMPVSKFFDFVSILESGPPWLMAARWHALRHLLKVDVSSLRELAKKSGCCLTTFLRCLREMEQRLRRQTREE